MIDDFEVFFSLPTLQDVAEAADGLFRIQSYYDIYCDDVKTIF